ncbi:MAG: hypothetical protein Q8R37_00320 [Nanoarchaeota archaeon]|nr:hypothetical protein [Nanoarchaeota archaeon]
MTNYQRLEINELPIRLKEAQLSRTDLDSINVEVRGNICQPIILIYKATKHPLWDEYSAHVTDFSKLCEITLFFYYSKYELHHKETFEKAYNQKVPVIVRGEYHLFKNDPPVSFIRVREVELERGQLSLTDIIEGKLSITEEGKLSFKK